MLRISYIKKTCPQCSNVYKICKSETQTSVGSPIINCKKCENQFVDPSFIVAVILKIFYIQKYGMIIKEVNANYIKKLS